MVTSYPAGPYSADLLTTLVVRPFLIIKSWPQFIQHPCDGLITFLIAQWNSNPQSLRQFPWHSHLSKQTKLCRTFIVNYSYCFQSSLCIRFPTTPIYQKTLVQQSPMMQHPRSEPVMIHTMFLSSSPPSKGQSNFSKRQLKPKTRINGIQNQHL